MRMNTDGVFDDDAQSPPDTPRNAVPLRHGVRRAGPDEPARRRRTAQRPTAGREPLAAGAAAAALSRQGQARHPPVHERRPVARRHLRPQAVALASTPASRCRAQPAHRTHDRGRLPVAVSASSSTARAASRSASCSRTSASCIDDICVIRSMHADVPNHEPSLMLMNCGDARLIRPSLGSWVTYGLGSENQNLPGFIAMCPGGYPIQETQNWQSAFLPGAYQGTYIDTQHTDIEKLIENIRNTAVTRRAAAPAARPAAGSSTSATWQRRRSDAAARSPHPVVRAGLPHADATPSDAFDISREPQSHPRPVRPRRAGPAAPDRPPAARKAACASCRSGTATASRGTTTTISRSTTAGWPGNATRPIAALLKDLKQRGMLDEHAGDLGRRVRPHADGGAADAGRRTRARSTAAITTITASRCGWPAAASRAATSTAPPTSSASRRSENKVHVHDLHATILHLLGFDHEKLTYRYAGRDFRLTDVHGRVVREILA